MELKNHEIKHLEFIQGVISRMARNSFLIKGWAITLVAALFALASQDASSYYVVIALFPAILFWGLDTYYLRQERLFRRLYDHVRKRRMTEEEVFTMDTSRVEDVGSFLSVAFSRTIWPFYVVLIATIGVVIYLSS